MGDREAMVQALRDQVRRRRDGEDVDVVLLGVEVASAAQAVGLTPDEIAQAFDEEHGDAG